jgi:hypothetical protein
MNPESALSGLPSQILEHVPLPRLFVICHHVCEDFATI